MKLFNTVFSLIVLSLLTSCFTEDPGALQKTEKEYSIYDFDRLQMGSAFRINVVQGEFSVSVSGDKRNLDDLKVWKDGSTLKINFDHHVNRKHETYINISMPALRTINFSGASDSNISGFTEGPVLDFALSGASTSRTDISADEMNIHVSGASYLKFEGNTGNLDAEVSGASVLSAYKL